MKSGYDARMPHGIEADEGTRTLDLLHGKDEALADSSRQEPPNPLGYTAPSLPGATRGDSNRREIYLETDLGRLKLDVATGKRCLVRAVPGGVLSPDGTGIANTAGGEGRDRVGIYVANIDGSGARRVSNSCRVVGTDGPDVLQGRFSQVLVGLAGNDTLHALDTYYYFDGNTLLGGPGDDLLIGGEGMDTLYGGPGDDRLDGGMYKDTLVGGPGHDQIDGGTGNDVIGGRDLTRDRIVCGTSGRGSGVREHDVVYADRVDAVASDCEIVHRR